MRINFHPIALILLLAGCASQPLLAHEHKPFGEIKKANENSTLNRHLLPEGEFAVGKDQWGAIVRVNMLKIKDWSKVPGVKKAWTMTGHEGEQGMAFHPVISEVKDVDADGDGLDEIFVNWQKLTMALNVDGMFAVWNGKGERLYAISFLPGPSKRTWSDKNNGGSWSHAMPGGHEGIRRQIDLDNNGRADFIMPFGAWHWGSDSILFLMEGKSTASCVATHAADIQNLSKDQVQQACRKAADWQLANPNRKPVGDWAQGPFVNGLFAISKMPDNQRYLDAVIKMGEKENWGVITTIHPANDHCTPQTWLDIYQIKKDPKMLAPTRKALDAYIKSAESSDDNLDFIEANRHKWSWCDALYMSPPTFARMFKLTGDKKYRDYLHTWWWKVSDYYYDADELLYYRDETFFKKREPNGKKVFWSRGNGWVVGGLVRVLQVLDKNDPLRPKYVKQLKEMCRRLADIQSEHGLWHSGLLDPKAHSQSETSGSAFYVYAMAYGVNEGILDRAHYLPVIQKSWTGLCRHLQPDGQFTGTQPIGDSPVKYKPSYTMPYGVGAFLLAGSEVYKLK